ncbi:hypothetical protein F53441_1125 [Fusarium austroafricanum]|uniref:Uncharacterized protein n=1 Tax=Fusarium austroafricanum TaxID=2364996 RepID=A0A8H4P4D6_9HYPO|nr:hypothetical protein F53441_1125 [Fusarium austroafricanum]
MTGRGPANYPPPTPQLETRPVPRERLLPVHSLGPGATPDILNLIQPIDELIASVDSESYKSYDQVCRFLQDVEHQDDPTWGFYVFFTLYTTGALENIESAVSSRFKLDILQEREALEDASNDRIREEFNSRIRALDLWADFPEDKDENENPCRPLSPSRLVVCLVFDEAIILQLAGLSSPSDPVDDYKAFAKTVKIKIIDRVWRRPESGRGSYPGVDACLVHLLPEVYRSTSIGDSGTMYYMNHIAKEIMSL